MAQTENYGLYVLGASEDPMVKDWIDEICGENESNMTIIDKTLAEKANKSKTITATLSASGWVGESAPYTQMLTFTGLGISDNGTISLAQGATIEQRNAARSAMLCLGANAQRNNKLIVTADGKMPTVDIPVMLTIIY